MTRKPKPNGADDLTPPLMPSDEEFQAFLDKCNKAGVSKGKFFDFMDEMWPDDEREDEVQTNA